MLIQSASFTRTTHGTFALRFKPVISQAPPLGTYPPIFSFAGHPGIYIQANTGRPYLQIVFPTAGGQAVVASTPVSSDSYTHVVGTWKWDGTNTIMRIYVNGIEDATPLSIADRLGLSSRALRVGGSGGTPIKGIVDEVLVYDRALSAQEIAALVSGSAQNLGLSSLHLTGEALSTPTLPLASRGEHEHSRLTRIHHSPGIELLGGRLRAETRSIIHAAPTETAVPRAVGSVTWSTVMVEANQATRAKSSVS